MLLGYLRGIGKDMGKTVKDVKNSFLVIYTL